MCKNTLSTYGGVTRFFHWIVGIMIITMLYAGFYMTSLESSDQKWEIYGIHKATGVIVLALVALRFVWRLINVIPDLPKTIPNWQAIGYRLGMKLMYIFMFLMPISGILMSLFSAKDISVYGIFTVKSLELNKELASIFNTIHAYSGIALACIIGFHILMALYHHLFVKDRLLMRIIVGK